LAAKITSIFLAGLAVVVAGPMLFAQKAHKTLTKIVFEHYVEAEILKLDSGVYRNALGQNFKVSNFKYYVSDVQLLKKNGLSEKPEKRTFLINEEREESKHVSLANVKEDVYTGIRFLLGVDSLHNCSGAQSGDLDPMNGMFWAWNTGYIFLKLEGTSGSSTAPGKIFEYHIGGYKQPVNCIKEVVITFENPLLIKKDHTTEIKIKADVAEILKGPAKLDFSVLPVVTDQKNSRVIADNYADMFTVIGIIQ
jgi:hypothetical protein